MEIRGLRDSSVKKKGGEARLERCNGIFLPSPDLATLKKTRRPLGKTVIVYRPGPCSTVCETVSNIEQPSLRIE